MKQNFGYTPRGQVDEEGNPTNKGLIGDRVWLDKNGDGVQDGDEPGLAGVVVRLYDDEESLLSTTTTDANGNYWFSGLDGGTYKVVVDTTTLPNGGVGMSNTGDPDAVKDSQSTVTIADGGVNLEQDFGYQVNADVANTIGGTIWEDRNADGTLTDGSNETADETGNGIAGVTVVLRDEDGNIVDKTTTDANGDYEFSGLPDGKYTIEVSDDDGKLRGWWKSHGPNEGDDNNSQPVGYTVEVGPDNRTDTTGDFGFYYAPASLGDWVWEDYDGNGLQDDGTNMGIGGIKVTLTITYPDESVVTVVTTTDEHGYYHFGNLLLDEDHNGTGDKEPAYTVSVEDPSGVWLKTKMTDDETKFEIDSNSHTGSVAVVTQGVHNATYDFGYCYPARIHGYGYGDKDGNLVRDPGIDPGTSNMLIRLFLDGVEVAVTNAAADGFYSFDNLKPGAYEIRFYGDNDYLTDRPEEGTPAAESSERNRAEKQNDYAVIYHTVYSGDCYREGSFNQPLNVGYRGTGPMSSGIDLRAYEAADGVYVEFIAYDVEEDGRITLYLLNAAGEVIWAGVVEVTQAAQQFARFKVPGLKLGERYNFAVRDEVGQVWLVDHVVVGTLATEMISMSQSGVVLAFSTLPERRYEVLWTARLGASWQPVTTVTAHAERTTVVVQPPDPASPSGFFKIVLLAE